MSINRGFSSTWSSIMIIQFVLYVVLLGLGLFAHGKDEAINRDFYYGLMCHSTSLSKSASDVSQGDGFYSLCGGPMVWPDKPLPPSEEP